MRIVAALGGNALLQRGEKPDASTQVANVKLAAEALEPITMEHELVLTHGNGPQVGVLAMESATDPRLSAPYPFDALGAMTQGLIGYWMLQALGNALPVDRPMTAVINQTLVAADDPAFDDPTKFVGEVYEEDEARQLADKFGWHIKQDGNSWRRVIASPRPIRIIEVPLIRKLLANHVLVVCAGGGGIPVIYDENDKLVGVEAVVDKDLTAAQLARDVDADLLMVLTDVEAVMLNYGTPMQEQIGTIEVGELQAMGFPPGSMGPKVDAVCKFVEHTGRRAAIGRLTDVSDLVAGTCGTQIIPNRS